MADYPLTLSCLFDGESTSNAFPVKIDPTKTVNSLKKLVKAEQSPKLDDIDANDLTLWRVSITGDKDGSAIMVDALVDKTELNKPRARISALFSESLDENTYILVQRPPPVHADVPAQDSAPSPAHAQGSLRSEDPVSAPAKRPQDTEEELEQSAHNKIAKKDDTRERSSSLEPEDLESFKSKYGVEGLAIMMVKWLGDEDENKRKAARTVIRNA